MKGIKINPVHLVEKDGVVCVSQEPICDKDFEDTDIVSGFNADGISVFVKNKGEEEINKIARYLID